MHVSRFSALSIAALACLCARASSAATFSGKVTLDGSRTAQAAIVTLDDGVKPQPLRKATVDQRDKMFTPHVSVVTTGTSVDFPNDDTVFHNVFAYFRAKKFDLGMYPRGASKRVTFDKPGVVALLCNVHPDMSAYIMVVDTPYYGMTDDKGAFAIKSVPPGEYVLRVWHESGHETEQKVTVGAADAPVSISLSGRKQS